MAKKDELNELGKERNRLNKLIRNKKSELQELDQKIYNHKELQEQVDALTKEVSNLSSEKATLQKFITTNQEAKNRLPVEIENLKNQQAEIEASLAKLSPQNEAIINENAELMSQKESLETEINSNKSEIKSQSKKINSLNSERNTIEEDLKDLRDKHKLYSKDMKSISLDSNKQLITYSIASGASLLLASTLMIILLCILTESSPYSNELYEFFPENANLRFYSIALVRISISAAFIFLIIVFLNLSRGFISQFIKARNRLTAIRTVDFLSTRLKSTTKPSNAEEENALLEIEREKLKQQVELLNHHIPKIMDLGSSSFEKEKVSFRQIEKWRKLFNTAD
jgi:predicted  nucleic acid-binding Zn-ribbon protein